MNSLETAGQPQLSGARRGVNLVIGNDVPTVKYHDAWKGFVVARLQSMKFVMYVDAPGTPSSFSNAILA